MRRAFGARRRENGEVTKREVTKRRVTRHVGRNLDVSGFVAFVFRDFATLREFVIQTLRDPNASNVLTIRQFWL